MISTQIIFAPQAVTADLKIPSPLKVQNEPFENELRVFYFFSKSEIQKVSGGVLFLCRSVPNLPFKLNPYKTLKMLKNFARFARKVGGGGGIIFQISQKNNKGVFIVGVVLFLSPRYSNRTHK